MEKKWSPRPENRQTVDGNFRQTLIVPEAHLSQGLSWEEILPQSNLLPGVASSRNSPIL